MAKQFVKDPDAVLDYHWNWAEWLADDGDTIASHSVVVPTGLTLGAHSNTSAAVTAWLAGGAAGAIYDVVCRIVTAGGRTDDRTAKIIVAER